MKANELRIGNWVLNQGELIELTKQKFKMAVISFNCQEIKPIPLTEEWLVRFGFNDRQIELNYPDKLLILGSIVHGNFYFYLEDTDGGTACLNYIKYVHELQNLYFALTGEELKTKQA